MDRLDSSGKVIRERTFLDPLYQDSGEFEELPEIAKASLETAQHPDIHVQVENLEAVFKAAGLRPSERRALMLRKNGRIMSRNDFKAWKRGQRAITRRRSSLVAAITEAVKKRVIVPPRFSAGSFTGVVREGGGYTRFLSSEDRPFPDPSGRNPGVGKWFESVPPSDFP